VCVCHGVAVESYASGGPIRTGEQKCIVTGPTRACEKKMHSDELQPAGTLRLDLSGNQKIDLKPERRERELDRERETRKKKKK